MAEHGYRQPRHRSTGGGQEPGALSQGEFDSRHGEAARPPAPAGASMAERQWRCKRCQTLLGVERGGVLHLKYKKARFAVRGVAQAVCRRCGELNVQTTSRCPPVGAPEVAARMPGEVGGR